MATAAETDRLLELMKRHGGATALVAGDLVYSYADLLAGVQMASMLVEHKNIQPGEVIGVQAAFSASAIALMLALFRRRCIVAFLSPDHADLSFELADACANGLFTIGADGRVTYEALVPPAGHPLIEGLRRRSCGGLILFSSGSSGRPKAILHDLNRFLSSYRRARKAYVTLAFLLFDHIAGLDTAFYTLHAGGALILTNDRTPAAVRSLVRRWGVEVLPVSPSFLKLLCLEPEACRASMTTVKIITFGSEPMDPATLDRVVTLFPQARLLQKYGASEFGVPAARTRPGNGLWIRFDEMHNRMLVEDGLLWLRTSAAMLGYLNADEPEMRDGWLCTGDRVEVDGDWLRILGRASDIINVGGEKVYPSEVESIIRELDTVGEVAVSAMPHPLLGQVVAALVQPVAAEVDWLGLRRAIMRHCLARLPAYKVPVKIALASRPLVNKRQKVVRATGPIGAAEAKISSRERTEPRQGGTSPARRLGR